MSVGKGEAGGRKKAWDWLMKIKKKLVQQPTGKQNKGKQQRSLALTVQKLLKFYECVQEVHCHWPAQQKQHSNQGQWNSLLICASCHFSTGDLCILDWWDPKFNCVPPTHWSIYFTFTRGMEWLKRQNNIKMACCRVPWSDGLSQPLDANIMRKSKLANQKHGTLYVDVCSGLQCFKVLAKYVWLSNICSWCLKETFLTTVLFTTVLSRRDFSHGLPSPGKASCKK